VRAITLDAYCAEHDLYPSFVKVDVEGHEWEVIAGARDVIAKAHPTVLIEVWADEELNKRLFEYMTGEGYRAYAVEAAGLHHVATCDEFQRCKGGDFLWCADEELAGRLRGA